MRRPGSPDSVPACAYRTRASAKRLEQQHAVLSGDRTDTRHPTRQFPLACTGFGFFHKSWDRAGVVGRDDDHVRLGHRSHHAATRHLALAGACSIFDLQGSPLRVMAPLDFFQRTYAKPRACCRLPAASAAAMRLTAGDRQKILAAPTASKGATAEKSCASGDRTPRDRTQISIRPAPPIQRHLSHLTARSASPVTENTSSPRNG